jgi:hypothetical protein
MKKVTRREIRLVAFLVLLVLVTYLAVHRNGLTVKEAEDEAVGEIVKVGRMVVLDKFAIVASLVLVTLFGFVAWTVLRGHEGEDTAMPPGDGVRSTEGGTSRHG